MNKKEVLKSVCELVSEHLELPLEYVKKNVDVPFLDYVDENGESTCGMLDYTDLLMGFEEEFDIEIPMEDEDMLTTINDVVEYIMTAEVVGL